MMCVQQEVRSIATLRELYLRPVDGVIAERCTRVRQRLHHKRGR
jgi:hypothetical protein